MVKLQALYVGLQTSYTAQTARLNSLLADHACRGDLTDSLRGDLAHIKEDAERAISSLKQSLGEVIILFF